MKKKLDWADEIAQKLEVGIEGQGADQFIAAMSKALRKAKADGLREASDLMKNLSPGSDVFVDVIQLAVVFDEAANKIEKGEA